VAVALLARAEAASDRGAARLARAVLGSADVALLAAAAQAHAGLAQADHLSPAFLLRCCRQLAHVHMLHAAHLGRSYLPSRAPGPDQ
jgi:hypothetical protein